jgi:hypothetical protein
MRGERTRAVRKGWSKFELCLLTARQLNAPHPLPPLRKGEGETHERIEAGAEALF